jgi:predicted transcriptional regulator
MRNKILVTVLLRPDQLRALKALAEKLHSTRAQLMREAIDRHLEGYAAREADAAKASQK